MKVSNIVAITRARGVSKTTNNAYDMPRLITLKPFEAVDTGNYKLDGIGHIPHEYEVDPLFYPELEARFKKDYQGKPLTFDLDIAMNNKNVARFVGFQA